MARNLINQHPSRALETQGLLEQWEKEVDPPLYDQRRQAQKIKRLDKHQTKQ